MIPCAAQPGWPAVKLRGNASAPSATLPLLRLVESRFKIVVYKFLLAGTDYVFIAESGVDPEGTGTGYCCST